MKEQSEHGICSIEGGRWKIEDGRWKMEDIRSSVLGVLPIKVGRTPNTERRR